MARMAASTTNNVLIGKVSSFSVPYAALLRGYPLNKTAERNIVNYCCDNVIILRAIILDTRLVSLKDESHKTVLLE